MTYTFKSAGQGVIVAVPAGSHGSDRHPDSVTITRDPDHRWRVSRSSGGHMNGRDVTALIHRPAALSDALSRA